MRQLALADTTVFDKHNAANIYRRFQYIAIVVATEKITMFFDRACVRACARACVCLAVWHIIMYSRGHISVQLCPSPMYPYSHLHVYDPTVLTHVAFSPHGAPSTHSFSSETHIV